MGSGIEAARQQSPEHAKLLDDFKDQLLIVFLKRLKLKYNDDLAFPVSEIDDTGQDMLLLAVRQSTFNFVLSKKS